MKHSTIPPVPIAVAHLSNTSNPTRNDNPNYPSPMFVVAQNSPPCTRLVLSLRFKIPLVVGQKSPCRGGLGQKRECPSISRRCLGGSRSCATEIVAREGRNLLRPHWTPRIGGEQMAGQALGRFALQRLGQDTQDTQDSQDCACLVLHTGNRPNGTMPQRATLSLARKHTLPPSWVSWVSWVSWSARQKMKFPAGGPPTPSGTPYGTTPLTGNAAILAAHD